MRHARVFRHAISESFVTGFINYFMVIDPIGNALIFLTMTKAQDRARKLRLRASPPPS